MRVKSCQLPAFGRPDRWPVAEEVPRDPVPHLVSHVHRQGFGGVVSQVPGVVEVLVRAAFQGLAVEAEALPRGLALVAVAVALVLRGPVGVDFGARVPLDGALDGPHRAEQLLQPGQVAGLGDSQRQDHDRHLPRVGLLPLRSLVLPPELAGILHNHHLPSMS